MLAYVALGFLVLALLMALVYPKGYKGGSPKLEGLRFGVIVGLIAESPTQLVSYGVRDTGTLVLIFVETLGQSLW